MADISVWQDTGCGCYEIDDSTIERNRGGVEDLLGCRYLGSRDYTT